jgi:phosphatidate cytidylyltransferase
MLRWRLLLGALFIAALAGLCWLDGQQAAGLPPGGWLFPLAILLSLAASGEMLWLLGARDRAERPLACLVYGGNLAIVASNAGPIFWPSHLPHSPVGRLGWPLVMFVAAGLATLIEAIWRYEKPGRAVTRLALAIFALFYVGLLLSFVVQLRVLGGGTWGLAPLVSLIAIVKMGDTGAYTVGRLIGRHKMTPLLSPGKTWEGAAGGMAFSAFTGWLIFWLLGMFGTAGTAHGTVGVVLPLFRWQWIGYGLVVGVAGLLGDLAESLLKRDAGRKDSSPWMPGFGGLLDVLDSILFAAPVAWVWWTAGWVP